MNWRYKVNFRHLLGEDDSQESMLRAAGGIRKELSSLPIFSRLTSRILDDLQGAAELGNLDWFNASLGRLWDWCDANSVWVELDA